MILDAVVVVVVRRSEEWVGADGGGRTHTLSRVPDFESSASANSATSAPGEEYYKSEPGEVNNFH